MARNVRVPFLRYSQIARRAKRSHQRGLQTLRGGYERREERSMDGYVCEIEVQSLERLIVMQHLEIE